MTLPTLENFDDIHKLHQAAMLFGPINNVTLEKQANWLHLATQPYPEYLIAQKYPKGGQLSLQFKTGTMLYQRPSGEKVTFPLADHTQKSLFEALLSAMQADELSDFFDALDGESLAEKMFRKIHAKKPETLDAALAEHTHEDNLAHDSQVASDYASALDTIYTGIARWRGRVNGHLSPIVVWAEHFDLSTLWFADPEMDENKPHINIGFAPFTEGVFERPYLYAYAYPYAENYTAPELTAPLKWETEAYTGMYVAYDDLVGHENPEQYIEEIAGEMFADLRAVLG